MKRSMQRNLSRSYPAIHSSVPEARRAVAALARSVGASRSQVDAIKLAVSEAVTNAVLHAYPGQPGAVHVTAAVTGDELWVLVADDGCGLETMARRPGLGLGLALIAQSAEDFTVSRRSSRGIELRMRFPLTPALSPHAIASIRMDDLSAPSRN